MSLFFTGNDKWTLPLTMYKFYGAKTSSWNLIFADIIMTIAPVSYTHLEKEEITHAVLAGQSAGGYVAQAFVQCYPEMADAFISIDSTPFGMKYYKKSELFWTDHYSAKMCIRDSLHTVYPSVYLSQLEEDSIFSICCSGTGGRKNVYRRTY